MNEIASKKYLENPDKKDKIENIKVLIERHNYLVDEVSSLEDSFEIKEESLREFQQQMRRELKDLNDELNETIKFVDSVQKLKKTVSSDFKQIIKKPLLEKLEKRIYSLKYDEFMYRDELFRALDSESNS